MFTLDGRIRKHSGCKMQALLKHAKQRKMWRSYLPLAWVWSHAVPMQLGYLDHAFMVCGLVFVVSGQGSIEHLLVEF